MRGHIDIQRGTATGRSTRTDKDLTIMTIARFVAALDRIAMTAVNAILLAGLPLAVVAIIAQSAHVA